MGGVAFLVLLRMGIGWHFLYEGVQKIDKTAQGIRPWSAQGYLGVAEGPFRETFRALADDPDGLERLNEAYLFPAWERHAMAYADRYRFDADKRTKMHRKLFDLRKEAREYLSGNDASTPVDAHANPDERSQARLDLYKKEIADYRVAEREAKMDYQEKRLAEARAKLAKSKATVTAPIDALSAELNNFLRDLRPDRAQTAAQTWTAKVTDLMSSFRGLPWMDTVTMWGIAAIGCCLLAGLFSRAAALGGFVFLAMIYLSRPPWPWLPSNPMAEGNYFLIDKNTVEAIALMALVFIPTGRWAGLDALIHRWIIGRQGRITEDMARQELARIPT